MRMHLANAIIAQMPSKLFPAHSKMIAVPLPGTVNLRAGWMAAAPAGSLARAARMSEIARLKINSLHMTSRLAEDMDLLTLHCNILTAFAYERGMLREHDLPVCEVPLSAVLCWPKAEAGRAWHFDIVCSRACAYAS